MRLCSVSLTDMSITVRIPAKSVPTVTAKIIIHNEADIAPPCMKLIMACTPRGSVKLIKPANMAYR